MVRPIVRFCVFLFIYNIIYLKGKNNFKNIKKFEKRVKFYLLLFIIFTSPSLLTESVYDFLPNVIIFLPLFLCLLPQLI